MPESLEYLFVLLTTAQVFSEAESYGLEPQNWRERFHGLECPMFAFTDTATMRVPYGYGEPRIGFRDTIRDYMRNRDTEAVRALIEAARDGAFDTRDDGSPLVSPRFLENIAAIYERNPWALDPPKPKRSSSSRKRSSGRSHDVQAAIRTYHLNADGSATPTNEAALAAEAARIAAKPAHKTASGK